MNVRAVRFPLFDSLRAMAVLAVFGYHALGPEAGPGSGAALAPYVANLGVGVSIFFVISGFLLYRPIALARVEGEPWLAVRTYAWRRFLRIVPAYWVALLVFALWLGTDGILSGEGVPRYWLFGQVYDADSALGGIPVAWSLDVEVAFYVLLPLLAVGLAGLPCGNGRASRLRRQWLLVAVLWLAGVAFTVLMLRHGGPARYGTVLHTLPSFLDTFAAGMALAVASVAVGPGATPRLLRPVDRFPGLAWLTALLLFVAVSTQIGEGGGEGPSSDLEFVLRRIGYALIAACLILPAVFGDPARGLVRRLLGGRVLLWVGLVSYSVFLYHTAVIEQFRRWDLELLASVHPYLVAVDTLLPSLAIAAVSYQLVERPAMRLRRLAEPPEEPQPGEAAAEPAPAQPVSRARPAD